MRSNKYFAAAAGRARKARGAGGVSGRDMYVEYIDGRGFSMGLNGAQWGGSIGGAQLEGLTGLRGRLAYCSIVVTKPERWYAT